MKTKILLKAPVLTRSGYGEQSRFALRSLRSREDLFDIYIQPLIWGATSWMSSDVDDEERAWIDKAIEKTIAYVHEGGKFDASLQVTIPNEWSRNLAPINIGFTAGIEASMVAPAWLQKGNEEVNHIIVVSSHSANVYKDTVAVAESKETGQKFNYKLDTSINHVNYPAKEYKNLPDLDLNLECDFNFLTVAQFGPRKNLPNTIKWFMEEFCDENVGLVVKTNMAKNSYIDRQVTINSIMNITNNFPDHKCKIYLLHGDMSDEEMHSLYKNPKISALLALPHGEGFGLPLFEASYSGLPVIATGWSGQMDFLVDENGNENFYNVAFDLNYIQKEVVWDNVLIAESKWAYPREQSAKQKMRQCYEDITNNVKDTFGTSACEYSTIVKERFSPEKQYKKFVSCLTEHLNLKSDEEWLSDIVDIIKEYE